jgi:hypothetical protein
MPFPDVRGPVQVKTYVKLWCYRIAVELQLLGKTRITAGAALDRLLYVSTAVCLPCHAGSPAEPVDPFCTDQRSDRDLSFCTESGSNAFAIRLREYRIK